MENASLNSGLRQDMFELEIDYCIIQSMGKFYESLRNAETKLRPVMGESYLDIAKIDGMLGKIEQFNKQAVNTGLFTCFTNSEISHRLKPLDYPGETIKFIEENLYSGEIRWSLLKSYGLKSPVSEDLIAELDSLILDIYNPYLESIKGLSPIERKREYPKIIAILKKLKTNETQKSMAHFANLLCAMKELINHRIKNIGSRRADEIREWIDYRLINAYLDSLTTKILAAPLGEDAEALSALRHNTEEVSKLIEAKDAWILAKYLFEESFAGAEILQRVSELLVDYTTETRAILADKLSSDVDVSRALKESRDELQEIYDLIVEKAVILFDFIDTYGNAFKQNSELGGFFYFKEVIEFMGIAEIDLTVGDRLELELCATHEVIYTDDIEKEYLIKEVFKKGLKIKDQIYRKAAVAVYRLNLV